MSTPRMELYRDSFGNPCPQMDYRDVPLAIMAAYLGIDKTTLWRRKGKGKIQAGVRTIGKRTFYKPALFVMNMESIEVES